MAKVVIAIIIVPFALFGIESLVGGGSAKPVVEVNGTPISEQQLLSAVSLQQRQLIAMMGGQVDPSMLDQDKLREPVLQRLITEQLLLQEAKSLGLVAPDAALNQQIASMPQFQENGQFSPARYQSLLNAQGLTPATAKDQLRREFVLQQLQRGIAGTTLVSERELNDVARLLEQTRSFSYTVVDYSQRVASTELSEAEIQAFYDERPQEFMRPQQVRVAYINLRLRDYVEPVSDDVLNAEFERVKQQLTPKTARHAAHILIEVGEQGEDAARAKAEKVLADIEQGGNFAELAKQYSDDAGSSNNGGDLGFSSGDAFPESFEKALATLSVGQVSRPVRTEAGFHLIKLLDIEEKDDADIVARAKADLRDRLEQQAAEPKLMAAVERLRDLSFNADGLTQPGKELQLEVQSSDWMTLDGGAGVLADPRVNAAIASEDVLKRGHNSDVLELAPDHFVVVHVDQRREAERLSFDEVREQVVERARRDKAAVQAETAAKQLLSALQGGQDFEQAVAAAGLEWQRAQAVKRSAVDVPAEVLQAAFELSPPGQGQSRRLTQKSLEDGSHVILALESVTEGNPESMDTRRRQALATRLEQNDGQGIFAAYLDSKRRTADIERM